METIKSQGKYENKNGKTVFFDFSFAQYESVDDAVSSIGEDVVLALINRMSKTDARNGASVSAQSANGDGKRVVVTLTEEQKAENKLKRAEIKAVMDKVKAKGLSIADLEALLA
jgi:hypothetical protein